MLEFLIKYFCGKDAKKRKKVRFLLNDIEFDPRTNEYVCKSYSHPDIKHHVIYSASAKEWKCDCEANVWRKYRTFQSAEDRYLMRDEWRCVHVIAALIHKQINLHT